MQNGHIRQDEPPEPALFQSDTPIRTSVESTDLTGRDVRPLDRTGRRSGARSVMPSVAGADVVIVVVDCVDGRLLRGRRTAVDSGVVCDQVGLAVRLGSLILGSQPACPGGRGGLQEGPGPAPLPRAPT